ncbi:MAG: UDP-N-acetylglucosamine 1-carboxyvinyltransferase [Elusimicrobia bacterium]|nr:UDP-N-acetylglucosamine 1-carboxyvinyltransferase [Elusimicrobiota bacterium]
MDKIIITGGKKLQGEVVISGSKNATLPIQVATLLTDAECTLLNVPRLRDINTMNDVLRAIGMEIKEKNDNYVFRTKGKLKNMAPYDLVKTMRASVLVVGPLLARLGEAKVALPGGCAIGLRPINIHLDGFRKLGAKVEIKEGYVTLKTKKLVGNRMTLDFPSVGATENLMMAAVLAGGKTVIENAAREPEIVDLADFLNTLGAQVSGAGTRVITIKGVKELGGGTHTVIPDRIETGTFMVASAITGGDIRIKNGRLDHLAALVEKLKATGIEIEESAGDILVDGSPKLKSLEVETRPYPGFPTDMQAQVMSLMCITPEDSIFTETIFENRFMHVGELQRMGAEIVLKGHSALVKGVKYLSGAPVMATDLRASAALILAGLVARGKTEISRIYHLDRGYERIEVKLEKLGAKIKRIK